MAESVDRHELENKTFIKYSVEEFNDEEDICFPLRTRYSTNSEIFNCSNRVLKYEYADDVKIADDGAHKRVIDCLGIINREKIEKIGLGFSPNLFEKLIERPLLYIDRDLVCLLIIFSLR